MDANNILNILINVSKCADFESYEQPTEVEEDIHCIEVVDYTKDAGSKNSFEKHHVDV